MRNFVVAVLASLVLAGAAEAAEPFFGFNLDGRPINPVCIEKMLPWISDSNIIVKSIVLEACQESNWAFHDGEVEVAGNKVSTAKAEDGAFSYEVFGRTTKGLYILGHKGSVAAYRIDEQAIRPDLLKHEVRKVHVLTAIASSFVPCLQTVKVEGDRITTYSNLFNPSAPKSEQCTKQVLEESYEIVP